MKSKKVFSELMNHVCYEHVSVEPEHFSLQLKQYHTLFYHHCVVIITLV